MMINITSVMAVKARIAGARYVSSFPVMSLVKDDVTMMTSSATLDKSLMPM